MKAMKKTSKKMKIFISVILCLAVLTVAVPTSVFLVRGSLKGYSLTQEHKDAVSSYTFENKSDIRVMSSNILVDYESWGGTPAKPRAAKYIDMINSFKPDVVGIQEMSDGWYCILRNNMPDGYKMLYPFSDGVFVRMTAMMYNSDALTLIDKGNFKYSQGDNPRLRRLVWGVFEVKSTGERFAVTNTHFDLLREGREEELTLVMRNQAKELLQCVDELGDKYSCPVFSLGDFNTMEDTPDTKPIDIPEIYNYLAENLTDAKYNCKNSVFSSEQGWDAPSYDHIFIDGNASADTFALLSYKEFSDMSDHYPIFADISID